ncbi:MAG TPA: GntR family transcriptional regulator [Longimicrobium sp.]|jgi:DNA-binding transcriptional regulator YhcF (GntR family)
MNSEQTMRQLRYRITGLLHVGRLRRGDPLPSIRAVARELGVDHRRVAEAYRALAAEGLVEIRAGSGVYLARDAGAGPVLRETEGWLSSVLLEGWTRRTGRRELAELVDRCARLTVSCACVESNEDHLVALAAELRDDFSLQVEPVLVSPSADEASIPGRALAAADLVVTTVFHEAAGRAAAARAGKPCIVLRLNPDFAAEVSRRLAGRQVTTVVADPRYAARAAAYLEVTPHRGQVRFALVDELGGAAGDVDVHGGDVLLTRAARRRLGLPEYHLVPSPPPYISRESAGELFDAIVRLGLEEA